MRKKGVGRYQCSTIFGKICPSQIAEDPDPPSRNRADRYGISILISVVRNFWAPVFPCPSFIFVDSVADPDSGSGGLFVPRIRDPEWNGFFPGSWMDKNQIPQDCFRYLMYL